MTNDRDKSSNIKSRVAGRMIRPGRGSDSTRGSNHFSHFSLFIHINLDYYLKAHHNSDSLAKITYFIDHKKCFYS